MKKPINTRFELLLAKIAGHNVDIDTMTPPVAANATEELLLEIADVVKDAILPDVTSDDDGSVLTVVDGEWAAAPASGGGSGVEITWITEDYATTVQFNDSSEQNEVHIPRTVDVDDLVALADAGTSVFVKYNGVYWSGTISAIDYQDELWAVQANFTVALVDEYDYLTNCGVNFYIKNDSPDNFVINNIPNNYRGEPVTVSIGYIAMPEQLIA